MNTSLANVLEGIDNLSYDELLTVQEKIIHRLRNKGPTSNGQTNSATNQPPNAHNRKLKIPGAYTPTPEEIEASLAEIFTPEEMAEMDKVDLDNLPTGPKSLSQMIIEDREARF